MTKILNGLNTEIVTFDQEIVKKIAKDWISISAKVKKSDNVYIIYDIGGRQLAMEVAKLCALVGCRVVYRVRDLDLDATLLSNLDEKHIYRYNQYIDQEIMNSDTVFMIRAARRSDLMKDVESEKKKIYNQIIKPIYIDYRVNHTNWQLMYWPTSEEAEIEGMDLNQYSKMFFEACNQPWEKIEEAQNILCDLLDQANYIEFRANTSSKVAAERTMVNMSIKGMSFCNSTVDNNFPGSEVFSSPVKESVNGQIFKGGRFNLGHEQKIVEDVFLRFENGKIVEARSKMNEEDLFQWLETDEGSRYIGEIAIGTNPGLRKNVFNPLLNEKVGGSFHITPGSCYKDRYDEKRKKMVHISNGNDSVGHWDITILMLPEYGGGEIVIDGKTIQKDGKFVVKGLEILNLNLNF